MRLELTILGSASQAPTRDRGQGGYVLRWEDELVLFDPGEGCQRQLLHAGLSAAHITRVCVTHFHGDHCLGLPGFVQSRALSTPSRVTLHYAASEVEFVDRLLTSSVIDFDLRVDHESLDAGESVTTERYVLSCASLDHPTTAIGYRLAQPASMHVDPERAAAHGIEGALIGELMSVGELIVDGRIVRAEDIATLSDGPVVAFVMDTAPCAEAASLAAGADVLVTEATFLDRDLELARSHGHMTAADAGRLAAEAGAGVLVLSHFSSRYDDVEEFAAEAGKYFTPVIAARDFDHIEWDTRERRLVDPELGPTS